MIDAKDTELRRLGVPHDLKAGDTPALGMPVEPGSGGKRRAYMLGIDVEATAEITVGDDVLWHDREATVVEVYPAGQAWLRVLCKIQFQDGGPDVVVGRDELQLVEADGARYFVSLAEAVLEDTAPLPSPVPRAVAEVPTALLEEPAAEPTEQLPLVGDVELDDEGQAALADHTDDEDADDEDARPTAQLPVVDPLTAEALTGVWRGLLNVLRIIGEFLAWPFRRDGGRALVGRIVAAVAAGVDASADWEHAHAELIAKVIVGVLSGLVLAGTGVSYVLLDVGR